MEEMIVSHIGNVGVPAVLCFYIIFTLNKSIIELKDALKDFSKEQKAQLDRIENQTKLTYELFRNVHFKDIKH